MVPLVPLLLTPGGSDADQDPDPACFFYVDPDPDPTCHFDVDLNPDPSYQVKAQNLEKSAHIGSNSILLACHLQIDADPDPAYHFDVDPDPDLQHCQKDIHLVLVQNLLKK